MILKKLPSWLRPAGGQEQGMRARAGSIGSMTARNRNYRASECELRVSFFTFTLEFLAHNVNINSCCGIFSLAYHSILGAQQIHACCFPMFYCPCFLSSSWSQCIFQMLGHDFNRTMLFHIGRNEIQLINPEMKSVQLNKSFKDIAHCCQVSKKKIW